MQWRVVAVAAVVVAAEGRASRAAERPWVEVRSPHFHVLSDAGAGTARETALGFEQIRGAFAMLGSRLRLDPGQPLTILAARDEKSLAQLLPGYFATRGGARPAGLFANAQNRMFVLLRADRGLDDDLGHSVLFHEYVHLLTSVNFRTLPLWLAEGLAEFYAHTTVQKGRVMVGRPSSYHVAILRDRRLLPFDEFFAADRDSPHYNEEGRATVFYAQSWALTHWLMLGDKGANRPRLQKFLDLLTGGTTTAQAAREALGTPAELSRLLDGYVAKHAFYMQTLPALHLEEADYATRTLPAGEVAAWRALVHVTFSRKEEARRAIEEALRLAPEVSIGHEANALLLSRDAHLPEARVAAAEALKRDPRSAPALMLAGGLAVMPGGAGSAEAALHFQAALEVSPANAMALVALAEAKAAAGAPSAETVALSRRAVELWPSQFMIRIAHAEQLLRHGDRTGALATAEQALSIATTDEERAAVRLVTETIKSSSAKAVRAPAPAADPAATLARKQEACEQGTRDDCVGAGVMLEKGEGAPADVVRAAVLYGRACDAGSEHGCFNLALVHHHGKGAPRDLTRARTLYGQGCTAGHAGACALLGDLRLRGEGGAKDEAAAADAYEKACTEKETRGCAGLAFVHAVGRGRAADLPKAFALYGRACEAGNAGSCEEQGWAYAEGRGTTRDLKRAVDSFDKGCRADPREGCLALGEWLMMPEVGRDYARAATVLDRACQAGEQKGCAMLAGLYGEGLGVAKDVARAEQLATAACDKGSPEGCATMAGMLAASAPGRAVPFFDKACTGGLLGACTVLAVHHMGGLGVPQSMPKAAALFTKACDGGDGRACSSLADLAQYGNAGAPDLRRAAALRKKACAAGYTPACTTP